MPIDLLIRNGTVIDGTGAPARRADVAIAGDRIVEVGRVDETAARTLDADGLVVAPGFVDPHTHYDAQICWDPMLSPSSWHGITTVVTGNCGVGIAPCRPEMREIAAGDLVNVESIPLSALEAGVTWDWETFPEYMDAADRRGLGINVGFLVALSPLRHYAMGEASMERAASAEETLRVRELLREALLAGALGFTTSGMPQHIGYQGRPLASRLASRDELASYAGVLRELQRGSIELALTRSISLPSDEELDLLEMLLDRSGRPVTWLTLLERDDQPEACQRTLARAEPLIRRGGVPQISARPTIGHIDLRKPFAFANHACWGPAFDQPLERQIELYRERAFREAFRKDLEHPDIFTGNWKLVSVDATASPALAGLAGRSVADIARERSADPLDVFLDLAIEDRLETQFSAVLFNADEQRVGRLLADDRTLIGLSDGGAHVDQLCDSGYTTHLLGHWVREREVLSLPRAVARLTSEPARFFGLTDRGVLAPRMAADLVLFDPERVGSTQPEMSYDLPGGGRRLVSRSVGVQATIVNGRMLYEDGSALGDLPGRVLRPAAPQ